MNFVVASRIYKILEPLKGNGTPALTKNKCIKNCLCGLGSQSKDSLSCHSPHSLHLADAFTVVGKNY